MPVQRKVFRIEEHARPRAPENRDALERARAQIVEAQAYKRELGLIYAAVERARGEMAALHADAQDGEQTARASRELNAIVTSTERATQKILQSTEEIDQAAGMLSSALKGGHDQGLAHDIQDRVVQIFEACNFQDLTGQRVAHVVATLKAIEDRVARLLQIWHGIEQFQPVVLGDDRAGDRRLLNGPALPGDRDHASQDDIDGMFRCA